MLCIRQVHLRLSSDVILQRHFDWWKWTRTIKKRIPLNIYIYIYRPPVHLLYDKKRYQNKTKNLRSTWENANKSNMNETCQFRKIGCHFMILEHIFFFVLFSSNAKCDITQEEAKKAKLSIDACGKWTLNEHQ